MQSSCVFPISLVLALNQILPIAQITVFIVNLKFFCSLDNRVYWLHPLFTFDERSYDDEDIVTAKSDNTFNKEIADWLDQALKLEKKAAS